MATLLEDSERIALTKLDTGVLLALLKSHQNGYGLAQQCADDMLGEATVTHQSVRYSLKSLIELGLVAQRKGTKPGPGKPSKLYQITTLGKQVLAWEVDQLEYQLRLYRHRSDYSD